MLVLLLVAMMHFLAFADDARGPHGRGDRGRLLVHLRAGDNLRRDVLPCAPPRAYSFRGSWRRHHHHAHAREVRAWLCGSFCGRTCCELVPKPCRILLSSKHYRVKEGAPIGLGALGAMPCAAVGGISGAPCPSPSSPACRSFIRPSSASCRSMSEARA